MKKQVLALMAASIMAVSVNAVAGDAAAGKAKAATCAACHGMDGMSKMPIYPNLKGQKEAYLVKQMKAFRDGTRKDPTMNAMAKPLSDADIDNLAAFYSGL
ncbi:MAG: cytochrome c [Gammaproteobacteria bacterium]|nr:MAG: cytochrome c [Gammaproteobacteria bacterium]